MAENTHIYEQEVIRNETYLRTVEAAVMQIALEVLGESRDTYGYQNRRAVAMALFLDTSEAARFARAFAWGGVFHPTIRGQVFKGPGSITPEDIDGEALRTMIRNNWNLVSNVSEPEESEE